MEDVQILAEKIRTFIATRLEVKLEDFDKKTGTKQRQAAEGEKQKLTEERQAAREQLLEKYQTVTWLTAAANKAWQISMVTHAPKYTHSATESMGILLRSEGAARVVAEGRYLDSLSLAELPTDAFGNAAALDVAALLKLQVDGVSLLDQIVAGESPVLQELSLSQEQSQGWLFGFSRVLQPKQLATGQLVKQLYFPVGRDQYQLLAPLYASSLSQILYERLTHSFFSDATKAARQARKNAKYFPDPVVAYPGIGIQNFGGSNKQNISMFNVSIRHGRGYLLSSQPPTWKQQQTPPAGNNAFWREYDRRAWKVAQSLRKYLENILGKNSTKPRRDGRAELVDELMDRLLVYAAEVQSLKERAGWSQESELSNAEQLWLDPHRGDFDADFKLEREKNDWQTDIAKQFASWLNRKISEKSDKLFTGDPEFEKWEKLFKQKLALLREDLEVVA